MLFVVYCKDKLNSDLRNRIRADHLRHIIEHPARYRLGCPLMGENGKVVGSLFVFDVSDRAELDEAMAADPYFREALFGSIEIHQTRQVIPETVPGGLAAELDRQLATR